MQQGPSLRTGSPSCLPQSARLAQAEWLSPQCTLAGHNLSAQVCSLVEVARRLSTERDHGGHDGGCHRQEIRARTSHTDVQTRGSASAGSPHPPTPAWPAAGIQNPVCSSDREPGKMVSVTSSSSQVQTSLAPRWAVHSTAAGATGTCPSPTRSFHWLPSPPIK